VPPGEKMIRLIACDVDGTLLGHGDTGLSDELYAQIAQLQRRGICFVPASGRQYLNLRDLFAPAGEELIYLSDNGALVTDHDHTVSKTCMPHPQDLELIRQIAAFDTLRVLASGERTVYILKNQPEYLEHIRDFVGPHVTEIDSFDAVAEPFIKISAFCPAGLDVSTENYFHVRWDGLLNVAISGPRWLDFTCADKGSGLAMIAQQYDLDPQEIMAFGDNFNDLPMLRFAGTPYVVEGADPRVKAQVPYVCDRVESVLRRILEENRAHQA